MRPNLRFGVVNTQEDLEKVGGFAASFDHEVTPFSTMPIVTISRGDCLFAYYNVIRQPIICPAFHSDPEVCSPRDFKDAFDAIRNHVFQSSMNPNTYPNGTMFMALPAHTKEKYGEKQMQELGLNTNGTVLYQAIG